MSDEVEVYVGPVAVPDASYMGWQSFSDMVFSQTDFFRRSRRSAHKIVRDAVDHYYMDEFPDVYRYFMAPAATVRKRLLIQGYTPEFCARSWEAAKREQVETHTKYLSDDGHVASLSAMNGITLEEWLDFIRREVGSSQAKVFAGRRQPWHLWSLLAAPNDVLVQLALLTDALPKSPVWMDCTFLYDQPDDTRTPQRIAQDEEAELADFPAGKIIVLTEGKTDTRIITAALRAFYPEFADAYQFLDFEEFRIEGGASLLARMIKVLSGARVQNRMLALFDNDAAGVEAFRSISTVRFPRNVRLMLLPDTKLGRNYPTLGPGGLVRMDVNGSGAPIELYLGRSSLKGPEGKLRPVRWNQWKDNVARYHGVVHDKEAVAEAFEKALRTGKGASALRKAFPEMDLLLQSIFEAFEGNTPPIL